MSHHVRKRTGENGGYETVDAYINDLTRALGYRQHPA